MAMGHGLEPGAGKTMGAAPDIRVDEGAFVDEDAMCKAVHYVFCGRMANHSEPNEKDREQARALIGALQMTAADQLTL
jgi:hypothetical protein